MCSSFVVRETELQLHYAQAETYLMVALRVSNFVLQLHYAQAETVSSPPCVFLAAPCCNFTMPKRKPACASSCSVSTEGLQLHYAQAETAIGK